MLHVATVCALCKKHTLLYVRVGNTNLLKAQQFALFSHSIKHCAGTLVSGVPNVETVCVCSVMTAMVS